MGKADFVHFLLSRYNIEGIVTLDEQQETGIYWNSKYGRIPGEIHHA